MNRDLCIWVGRSLAELVGSFNYYTLALTQFVSGSICSPNLNHQSPKPLFFWYIVSSVFLLLVHLELVMKNCLTHNLLHSLYASNASWHLLRSYFFRSRTFLLPYFA